MPFQTHAGMITIPTLGALAIMALLAAAAWRDVATRTVPDAIAIAIVAIGLVTRAQSGWRAMAMSLTAAVLIFLLLLIAHARGMLGGGDVKLIAAMACGLPLAWLYHFILFTALAGGALAILHLLLRRRIAVRPFSHDDRRQATPCGRVWRAERWRIARHGPLPYAVAIACGGIAIMGRGFFL